jgi:hypothetical protein
MEVGYHMSRAANAEPRIVQLEAANAKPPAALEPELSEQEYPQPIGLHAHGVEGDSQ